MGVDECAVQQRGLASGQRLGIALQGMLDDALYRSQVAADLQLQVVRGDPGGATAQHLRLVLGIGEALQSAFAQRVERHDGRAALRRFAQLAQHARMVGARVLAEDEDRIGLLEIGQRHRALADADLLAQRHARRLVAHV